jgi:hypothetical protein
VFFYHLTLCTEFFLLLNMYLMSVLLIEDLMLIKHFFSEQMTTVDADNLVTIKHVSMTSNVTIELDKITPGSEILLHLQVESHFPQGNIDLVPSNK